MQESQKQEYPYLHTYTTLYRLFSNNCTHKCKHKCVCKTRALLISDTLYDNKFQPYPHWL